MTPILLALLFILPAITSVLTYFLLWRKITKEIRRPIFSINGYAEMLLTEHVGPLTTKQRERVEIIRDWSATILEKTARRSEK